MRTPGHAEKALALLDEALDISHELGMGPLAAKSSDLLESIKTQMTHVAEYPDGLTRREVEVLCVLAKGKTNSEIGEELFISLNTVTRHLSHIYDQDRRGEQGRSRDLCYQPRPCRRKVRASNSPV